MVNQPIESMERANFIFSEPRKYEIHDGKIYYMAGTSTGHGDVSGNIFNIFRNFLKGKKCRVFNNEVNVTFKKHFRRFLPDVKIVCDPSKIKGNGIHGAPDLVVEVLSPRTKNNDKGYKFRIYEHYGVKEYWLVDISNKTIEVYLLNEESRLEYDNTYQYYSEEEIKEIEENDEIEILSEGEISEKELVKIKTFTTSIFGDDLHISIGDVFENID